MLAVVDPIECGAEQQISGGGGEQGGMKGERGKESLRKIGKNLFEQGECGREEGGEKSAEGNEEQKEEASPEKKVGEGNDEEGREQTSPRKARKGVGDEGSRGKLRGKGDDEEIPNGLKSLFEQAHAARVGWSLRKFGAARSEDFKR